MCLQPTAFLKSPQEKFADVQETEGRKKFKSRLWSATTTKTRVDSVALTHHILKGENRFCSMCPNRTCSSDGNQFACKCEFQFDKLHDICHPEKIMCNSLIKIADGVNLLTFPKEHSLFLGATMLVQ